MAPRLELFPFRRGNVSVGRIAGALADFSDSELQGLIEATYKVRQSTPGLLAWIDSACEWELNRRDGKEYELQPPEAAIPPEEDAQSIDAAIALRTAFADSSPHVYRFFIELEAELTGKGRTQ